MFGFAFHIFVWPDDFYRQLFRGFFWPMRIMASKAAIRARAAPKEKAQAGPRVFQISPISTLDGSVAIPIKK